jgi:uncharacterized protein YcbK (DUF882 family)
LTANFRLAEFASRGHLPTDPVVSANVARLAKNLQVLRDELGVAITVISGWRSQAHNDAVNGARHSRHMVGDAADIICAGLPPRDVFKVVERLIAEGKMEQGGLHAYGGRFPFLHYDCRGTRARWR